ARCVRGGARSRARRPSTSAARLLAKANIAGMRTLVWVVDAVNLFACMLAACSSSPGSTGGTDGGGDDAPGHRPGMPGLGAHALVYYGLRTNKAPSITTKGSRPNCCEHVC